MSAHYLYRKASTILSKINGQDRLPLQNACGKIRAAQKELLREADQAMTFCTEECRGLCCRNFDPDTVFSLWDFIYILVSVPEMEKEIRAHLTGFTAGFSAPCPFLSGGEGPCIFHPDVKPELCVVTFCSENRHIRNKARRVSRKFFRLCLIVQTVRTKRITKKLVPRLSKSVY